MKVRIILSLLFVFILCSCRKPDDLFGHVHFSGKVYDKASGQPVANMPVQLAPYKSSYWSGIWSENEINNFAYISPVLSDSNGNYTIDYDANGQTSFAIFVNSDYRITNNRLYVPSFSDRYNNKYKLGNYLVDLECPRSAIVKVNIKNVVPSDTAEFIAINTSFDDWSVSKLFRDTVAYVVIEGDQSIQNNFRFNNSKTTDEYKNITANSGDTVVLNYTF